MFFAVFGVILFGVIYTTSISGESLDVFRSPRIIGAILIPFLPAAIMSILAQRAEKKWLSSRHNIDENES
ncbi:MAG: hypothetical protein AB7E85_02920 [Pseudobdellovibrionaceae bacterium]